MHFVPFGEIYISEWQTRKRDFEAFVQATGYDAVGGMSSAVTQNGFKLNEMSWKSPGFQQAPDHPVVGVSWEDANQFCAWLTKKERSEGALATFQIYRLPTDREWSRAVGLNHEQGTPPRSGAEKSKIVYPWGNTFPPTNDVGDYAGSESRADAPPTWSVIPGFHDAFPRTAPVSAFKANARGLCDRWQRLGMVYGQIREHHELAHPQGRLLGYVARRRNAFVLSAWLRAAFPLR